MFERLRKIENLEQRQLLKDIVSGVLMNLVDYQDEMNKKLEERVFNEIEDWENKHDIYVTLCLKEDVDPIHDSLFPMIPTDLENNRINMKQLLDSFRRNESVSVLTLFLECDSMQIKQLLALKRHFVGQLLTTEGHYDVKFCLEQNTTYIEEIDKLYPIFQVNGLPWKTVNNPFAYKFFDVVLLDCPPLNEETEIIEFTIDLEEFDDKKRLDMIPLWNIERLEVKNTGFPIPATDKVNYEHTISIRKTGTKHGYLVEADEENIRYVKRSEDELMMVSPLDKSGIWKIVKIANIEKEKIGKLNYELVSNRKIDRFMNKFVNNYAVSVKTKGEIIRLVNSFEAAKAVELVDVEIVETTQLVSFSYPINPFLVNVVGEHSNKKVMLLLFKENEENTFVSNDILSFFVAEVQRHFYEYKCEGTWV
ncbi:normocyte-binding protein [Solibacillus sp. R5-41]|uniref:normocyte-binding protein n=1 Tax=Solibacillus sp. R5-41 TaxID=2048654 RepID=UPI0020A2C5BD|nr:normocyte-binding protein [Solibacillus sp. R5-41]